MQSEISFKWSLFIVNVFKVAFSSVIIFFLTTTFFLTLVFFFTPNLPAQGSYGKPISTITSQAPQNLIDSKSVASSQGIAFLKQASLEFPIRLKIPKINVDTVLEQVGLTSQGAVDVPDDITNAAWFDLGQLPGENGSAIITGHYGWENGLPAVFNDLHKLQKGDKLYVEDEKGTTITFVVRESRSYDRKAYASEVFGSDDKKPHLNLITCQGLWDKANETYTQRLVVFADITV